MKFVTVWYDSNGLTLHPEYAEAHGIKDGARWGDAEWERHFPAHCEFMIWKCEEAIKAEATTH